jgi:hypothetical protein
MPKSGRMKTENQNQNQINTNERNGNHIREPPSWMTCSENMKQTSADDTSTSRDLAFAKIQARIEGTRLAQNVLRKRRSA